MQAELLSSDCLGAARHGFFTRKGGCSKGIYAELNCGRGSADNPDCVRRNRKGVAKILQIKTANLIGLTQIHSSRAVIVNDAASGDQEADALVTNQVGFGLSVLTADCLPVLFHDAQESVIGAAHAGWRGALSGILEATLTAMEELHAKRARIAVAIGPAISQPAYEVGPEFYENFLNTDINSEHFFYKGENGRYLFNLPAYAQMRLQRAGVGQVENLGQCTYCDKDRFFSYRRSQHDGHSDYGRQISVIRL
ncbi:MAG: peptidoglycan editing factor PgeF [Aestuariivita sp.]|nr:peptidoglycan editing factor PgeF [Aestuariivita sp.]MCY4202120.1 peptidoglycan editing factor PgeF [Aestuariivita sp.]MCY4288045.1 peptidoglycan editing factor PgeF [Aestuariivita sp.]MCY4345813.1 peptidoglycan editing factor PgeF [Aestuariivita sp.]